jgi:hypothetical protein
MFESVTEQNDNDHSGSFMYWSVPYYWLRELRLSRKARSWAGAEGIVTSAHRTKGGYRETIRAELIYSYTFRGGYYAGRTVRDCCFNPSAATALAEDHKPGQKIQIFVNPNNPDESYYPSGFGSVEPFLTLFLSLLGTLLLSGIILGETLSAFSRQ